MDDTSHTSPTAPHSAVPDDYDWVLLARYVSGDATAAERARVESWADRSPARRAELEALRRIPAVWARLWPDVDGRPAWARMRERMATPTGPGAAPHSLFSRLRGRSGKTRQLWPRGVGGSVNAAFVGRAGRAGAALVVLALASLLTWHLAGRKAPQPFREFSTPAGSRATIALRDGTHVVLGPATRLRVRDDFGRRGRAVELNGEALFTVVHDARNAFAVQTARIRVRDMGTTFVVSAYAPDAADRVAVAEGTVAIGATTLGARDVASIDASGRVAVMHGVEVSPYLAWTQGRLVFHDTPLRQVALELSRAFDLDVAVPDSVLGTVLVTAAFDNEPVDEVLDAVARIAGGRYRRAGRRVTISPVGGAAMPSEPSRSTPLAVAQERPR